MNKNLLKIVTPVFLIFMLAAGALSYCQDKNDSDDKSSTAKPKILKMSGTVAQVEFVKAFIMVTSEAGYITISVPDDIPISRGTKAIDLDEIDAGDSVMVQYYCPEPGKYVAVSIRDSTPLR